MKHKSINMMILAALFAALTAVGTVVLTIPVGELSITTQVFFACMAGLLLGPYWGAASQFVYVALGLAGLPIFAGRVGGLTYVAKPSFGFLPGLILMAFVIGLLTAKLPWKQLWLRMTVACVAGLVVLYLVGLPYMYFILEKFTFGEIISIGCLAYLPYDAIKIVCAVLLASRLVPLLRRSGLLS